MRTNSDFDDMADEEQCFHKLALRQYQRDLVELSKKQNSIIFLPAGSGKTFIALQVLRSRMSELMVPEDKGGKIAVFLGTTKILVNQLAKVVADNTNLRVKAFTAEMGIDDWTDKTWRTELENVQVLIMVPVILLMIFQKTLLRPDRVSLLVFDECHHAVLNHPYRQIMQEFSCIPDNKKPLILGLTATVLNSNPAADGLAEVKDLRETLNCTFAKTDYLDEALRYGSTAKTRVITYASLPEHSNGEMRIQNLLNRTIDRLQTLKFLGEIESKAAKVVPKDGILIAKKNVTVKGILNIFRHVERVVNDLGLYSTSIVALYYYIRLERLKLLHNNPSIITLIKYALTVLNVIRRIVFKFIPVEHANNIRKFSSAKVNTLINIIDEYKNQENLKCIIMVEERITAVVMSAMFNELSRIDNKFYKADFITGGLFNSVFDQEETKFEQKRVTKIIGRFKDNEFKFLFATDVIEEGIDIPSCNLVIKFDSPKDYRTYIQSRGRARFRDSDYIVLCKTTEARVIEEKMEKFNTTHNYLLKVITAGDIVNTEPARKEEKKEEEEEQEEIFFPKGRDGPHISAHRAVSFIMRYCQRLPQDNYSFLQPICWYNPKTLRAFLLLPSSSPLRGTIEGDPCKTRKQAKRNVFLKAVKELHKLGEVLDDLSLRSFKCKEDEHEELFSNLIKISHDERRQPERRKKYEVGCAESLSGCMPQPCMNSYIHVIKITPKFTRPEDSRLGKFYDILCDPNGFAILSSKCMSEICEFPLFQRMGEFKCNLVVNAGVVVLSSEDAEKLKKFHFFIFNTVLRVVHKLQVFDNDAQNHSFYIIPVKYENNHPVINWDVISDRIALTESAELDDVITENPTLEDYLNSVVYPKYRQMTFTNKYYIATSLDFTQTPMSQFPSEDFENYFEYFLSKYQLRIMNKVQPLMEVKAIPEKINYLKPRNTQAVKSRKRCHDDDDFKEHLVPELCNRISFPALIWLKATLLPSVLYRIMTVSQIDDIRKIIASKTKLGVCELGSNMSWLPLEVDKNTVCSEETHQPFEWTYSSKQETTISQGESLELQPPVDLFRHMNECAPCDLIHYVKYFGLIQTEDNSMQSLRREEGDSENVIIARLSAVEVPDLPILLQSCSQKGPELRDIVKAFTCKSANDIVDLEKLEFLGDSFLKFSAALYVFRKYPDNEGVLVSIKDRIISNSNLYSCGIENGVHSVLLTGEFDPKYWWNAPLFDLPPEIKSLINKNTDSFEIEDSFEIPVKDKLSGKLSPNVVKKIQDFLGMDEKRSAYPPDEAVLRRKTIENKCISDCVEALLGIYVKECGLKGGFKMLNWLHILPETDGSYNELMEKQYFTENEVCLNEIFEALNGYCYADLEKILRYEFKDKSLLLQALTHPSDIRSIVCSYQRLEFLGDAVLDFLVTAYIHCSCPELPPGNTTDIRMSVVNNVTMACIAVKYNLHKYLIYLSSSLMGAINQFVSFQKDRNHKVDDTVIILNQEGEPKIGGTVEVPKALGDLFESLAGAIFLDSGNSLQAVWRAYYPLIKDTIELFMKDPPKSPIRKLYEYCNPRPTFTFMSQDTGFIVATCKIIHKGKEEVFFGKASSKHYSKLSAAKLAVRFLEGIVAS